MSHTLQSINNISKSAYQYLHENLPKLKVVSPYVERTNYYSAKGVTQIELITYEFSVNDKKARKYYLSLRYNPSVIMGESKVFVLDSNKYSSSEIIERIQKRFYEINEFRYIKLHEYPIAVFRAKRADIAEDITYIEPKILVWLCNMSMPYKYRRMKRKSIKKDLDKLYFESCCFQSGSREINFYDKYIAMVNTGKEISQKERPRVRHTFRAEIQIKKTGIDYLATKLPTQRAIQPFLEYDFCHEYLLKEVRSIFGVERYVSMKKAVEIISNSRYKPFDKAVMVSIINAIQQFKGLYELEKAIDDENIHTPPQYGNLRSFRNKWLKKFRELGIQPAVIPDSFGITEVPSVYELLERSKTNE